MDDEFANPWTEPSEVWVLNPGPNIDICFDLGISRFVFPQKTYQFKRNMAIDPKKLLDFFARGRPWQAMLVEYDAAVALVFDSRKGWRKPVAAYPSWSMTDDKFSRLKRLCSMYPEPGDTIGAFWGNAQEYGPVKGQDKVILIRNPHRDPFDWQTAMSYVADMKRYFPDIKFHMHGGKSVARTIGISIDSSDHPVTIGWRGGQPILLLPNGQNYEARYGDPRRNDHWAKLVGESMAEFRRLAKRGERKPLARWVFRFNLKSLIWAQRNQDRLYAFQGKRPDESDVDFTSSDDKWVPRLTRYRPRVYEVADKWLCDTCTIAHRCPYSRSGAICIVDGTEASKLSEKFRSRKVSDIIDGASALLSANAERLEKALVTEQEKAVISGEYRLSPQVTSLANGVFDRAIQMARLLDPQMATQMANGRVNVGIVNANAGAVAAATPQELMAGVAAKLEQFGIPLHEATMEQVEAIMRGEDPPMHHKALEVGSSDDDPDF